MVPYLRSLPAVGVANALAFVLRPILVMMLDTKKTDFQTTWNDALKQRDDDPESESVEDTGRALFGRWL